MTKSVFHELATMATIESIEICCSLNYEKKENRITIFVSNGCQLIMHGNGATNHKDLSAQFTVVAMHFFKNN